MFHLDAHWSRQIIGIFWRRIHKSIRLGKVVNPLRTYPHKIVKHLKQFVGYCRRILCVLPFMRLSLKGLKGFFQRICVNNIVRFIMVFYVSKISGVFWVFRRNQFNNVLSCESIEKTDPVDRWIIITIRTYVFQEIKYSVHTLFCW